MAKKVHAMVMERAMSTVGEVFNADDHDQEEIDDLKNALEDWTSFGLFSIFMTHPHQTCFDSLIRILPILLLSSQWMIPLGMGLSQWREYKEGWCPATATLTNRFLIFAIAVMYFCRSVLIFGDKYVAFAGKNKKTKALMRSKLSEWGHIDDIMDISYEGILYVMNLWLVFIATSPLDIVLNSLAMEFVMQLDNEFKENYFKLNGRAVRNILHHKWHILPEGKKNCVLNCLEGINVFISPIICLLVPLCAVILVVYGPLCKP
jgi:hypothetical protein